MIIHPLLSAVFSGIYSTDISHREIWDTPFAIWVVLFESECRPTVRPNSTSFSRRAARQPAARSTLRFL